MSEAEKMISKDGVEELSQKKKKLEDVIVSRRSFLSRTGVIIAAGALSHFVFIGRANAREHTRFATASACGLDCAPGTCVTVLGSESCNATDGSIFKCDPTAEYKCGAMTGNPDNDPPPCTKDCMIPYVTDCFVGLFDSE